MSTLADFIHRLNDVEVPDKVVDVSQAVKAYFLSYADGDNMTNPYRSCPTISPPSPRCLLVAQGRGIDWLAERPMMKRSWDGAHFGALTTTLKADEAQNNEELCLWIQRSFGRPLLELFVLALQELGETPKVGRYVMIQNLMLFWPATTEKPSLTEHISTHLMFLGDEGRSLGGRTTFSSKWKELATRMAHQQGDKAAVEFTDNILGFAQVLLGALNFGSALSYADNCKLQEVKRPVTRQMRRQAERNKEPLPRESWDELVVEPMIRSGLLVAGAGGGDPRQAMRKAEGPEHPGQFQVLDVLKSDREPHRPTRCFIWVEEPKKGAILLP